MYLLFGVGWGRSGYRKSCIVALFPTVWLVLQSANLQDEGSCLILYLRRKTEDPCGILFVLLLFHGNNNVHDSVSDVDS